MAQIAIISSRDLFDKRNNPSGRIDAGFGIALGTILENKPVDNARETLQGIWKNETLFKLWIRLVRKQTTLKGVENLIAMALLGKSIDERQDPKTWEEGSQTESFSPTMQDAIRQMAKSLCEQEANLIESEIAGDLARIATLKEVALA